MSGLDRDGYDLADAQTHPRFAELSECEACERWFEGGDRSLWVGWSGSSITCIHCVFAAHAGVIFDESTGADEREDTLAFLDELTDEAGEVIGGIAGYRRRHAGMHDSSRCIWKPYHCLLCDPREPSV
jgi:hypothetical protein